MKAGNCGVSILDTCTIDYSWEVNSSLPPAMGKVMFLHLSVSNSVHRGEGVMSLCVMAAPPPGQHHPPPPSGTTTPWTTPPPRTASPYGQHNTPQTAPPPGQHISWNQVHVHVLLGMLKGNSLTPETSYMQNNNHGSDCKLGVETSYALKWITPILLPLDPPKDEIFVHEKSFVGTY